MTRTIDGQDLRVNGMINVVDSASGEENRECKYNPTIKCYKRPEDCTHDNGDECGYLRELKAIRIE